MASAFVAVFFKGENIGIDQGILRGTSHFLTIHLPIVMG